MPQESIPFLRPAFIVGVTGNVDPHESALNPDDPAHSIDAVVRRILRFLKHGAKVENGALYEQIKASLQDPEDDHGLGEWPGLPNTPIVVLSSLAPGADTIVAQAALDLCFPVRAFLPFDLGLYPDASTFVEDRLHPTEEEIKKQDTFRKLAQRIGRENIHSVLLKKDLERGEESLLERMRSERDDLKEDKARRKPRSYRYQAAGQYIAAHCDLLLALWDDEADTGKPEGTGSIVEAKLRGIAPGLLPSANAFTWADTGPVLHIYMRRKKNGRPPRDTKAGTLRLLHPGDFSKDLLRPPQPKPWWRPAARLFSVDPDEVLADPPPVTRGPAYQAVLAMLWGIRRVGPGKPDCERWAAYRDWQTSGTLFLCRLARNLDTFNAGYDEPKKREGPLVDLLDLHQKGKSVGDLLPGSRPYRLAHGARKTFDALAPLQAARRYAADKSGRELRTQSQQTLRCIFWLVFFFAVGAHVFTHWEIKPECKPPGQPGTSAHAAQPETNAELPANPPGHPAGEELERPNPPENVTTSEDLPFPVQKIASVICVAAGIWSLARFWRHRAKRVEERDQDYRALSEGLRVQIAWCLAGLPRSAAGHYMERQRNELEWVRSAMSSLAMPHHRWERWFNNEPDDSSGGGPAPAGIPAAAPANPPVDLRKERLHWVEELWVDEQATYHTRRSKELTRDLHFFHKTGSVLALSGALQVFASACEVWFHWLETKTTASYARAVYAPGLKVALLTLAGLTAIWMVRSAREVREETLKAARLEALKETREEVHEKKRKQVRWGPAVWKALWPSCCEFMEILVPAHYGSHLDSPHGKFWRMLLAFTMHLPAAVWLSALATSLCVAARETHLVATPEPSSLMTIASGVFLVAGALLAAWAEKNLLSEQAYQYNAMASLFNSAKSRLRDALEDLDKETDPKAIAEQIRHIHQMLYDLGIEALDENAEWLILHRSRPMEPMLAG